MSETNESVYNSSWASARSMVDFYFRSTEGEGSVVSGICPVCGERHDAEEVEETNSAIKTAVINSIYACTNGGGYFTVWPFSPDEMTLWRDLDDDDEEEVLLPVVVEPFTEQRFSLRTLK